MEMFEQMKKEHARLAARISQLEHAVAQLPEGSLGWYKRGGNFRYYHLTDTKHFLSLKKDHAFIEELAKKKYLQKLLSDAKIESSAIEKYLKSHREHGLAKIMLTENTHIADILSPLFRSTDQELAEWSASDYPSTAAHPEQLIFPGPCGKMYRSKSESQIAYLLYTTLIPFRYEWDKTIGDKTYSIDFTIRHPKTGRTIYWEHCGMMDNEGYATNIGIKLRDFEKAGIFPGKNLILTFESRQFPFTIGMAEEIIQKEILKD